MDFDEVLDKVVELLQREQQVSYRALKLRFGIDDEYIAALKEELIDAKRLAIDENDKILVWTGGATGKEPENRGTGEREIKRLRTADCGRRTECRRTPPIDRDVLRPGRFHRFVPTPRPRRPASARAGVSASLC